MLNIINGDVERSKHTGKREKEEHIHYGTNQNMATLTMPRKTGETAEKRTGRVLERYHRAEHNVRQTDLEVAC